MRPSPWNSVCWAANRTASLGSSSNSSRRGAVSATSTRSRFSAARARTIGCRSCRSTIRRGSPSGSNGHSAAAWARRRQRRLRSEAGDHAGSLPVTATRVRSRSSASPSRSAARRWVTGRIIEPGEHGELLGGLVGLLVVAEQHGREVARRPSSCGVVEVGAGVVERADDDEAERPSLRSPRR